MPDPAWLLEVPGLGSLLAAEQGGVTFFEAIPILRNGMLASLMCAALGAFLGVQVILRRIVFVAIAISQVSSLGLAGALWLAALLGHQALASDQEATSMLGWPGLAAVGAALAAASLSARQRREGRLSRESLLGVAYVLPAGLVWLILHHMAGESHMVDNVLFGNAIFVATPQLLALGGVALGVAAVHAACHAAFVSASFEPTVAAAEGLPVALYDQVFYGTLAVAIAFMIGTIGVMPVFAFMVLPSAGALLLANRLGPCLVWSVGLGLAAAAIGFYLSFVFALPTGPLMIAVAGVTLVPGLLLRTMRGS